MNRTNIEWVQNPDGSPGYTFNPITGCRNHVNGLCKGGNFPCYAYRLAHGRLKERYLANHDWAPISWHEDVDKDNENHPMANPFFPRFWPERLNELGYFAAFDKHPPKGIFVCDMGELFGPWLPHDWTKEIIETCGIYEQHRFYLLTKQPQNLVQWSPFPENCWVGVTVCNAFMLYKALEFVGKIDATKVYLSLEPLLDRIKLPAPAIFNDYGISWLIIGGCTGTMQDLLPLHHKTSLAMVNLNGNRWSLQPQIEWVQEIVEAADEAGVKVFLKDNLKPLLPEVPPFYDYLYEFDQAEDHYELRQEMPSEGGE